MEFFIKKLWEGKENELVHSHFVKFGKGFFPNRALVKVRKVKGKYSIATTSEYSKDIILYLSEKLGDKKTQVQGAVISIFDLEGQLEYKERKMAMGVKKYMIDREMSGEEIKNLCEIKKAFFALSFSVGETELKIKPKSPKSAKSAGKDKPKDKLKIDFIKIKTSDEELFRNFVFEDVEDFKKIIVNHNFEIKDIVYPENKDEMSFAEIREKAERKGNVIRELEVDGEETKKEKEFLV